MASFLPPYQFIPFKAQSEEQLTPQDDILQARTHIRHDLYHPETHSGRIIARIDIKRPTVVGGKQETGAKADSKKNIPGTPGTVKPYKTPQGDIAIPANSLRGVIGSTAETISNSAMRVFDDQLFSTRKPMSKGKRSNGFQAIGLLRKFKGELKIQPLALLLADVDTQSDQTKLEDKWFKVFAGRPLSECLGACIAAYKVPSPVLPRSAKCFQLKHNAEYHHASISSRLKNITLDKNFDVSYYKDDLNHQGPVIRGLKAISSTRNFCYAGANNTIPHAQRGVLYVLGVSGRESDMPQSKKFEWFLPFPDDFHQKAAQIRLGDGVIDTFNTIAKSLDERCKKNTRHNRRQQKDKQGNPQTSYRPFLPAGYESHREEGAARSDFSYWLAEGDLVYFDVDDHGTEVTEIAYSNLWRQAMEYSTYELVNQNISQGQNLLPWGSSDENNQILRSGLTVSESLFGVVADNQKARKGNKPGVQAATNVKLKALSSRVQFSDARAVNEVKLLESTILKILASPKPPSPSMYLKTDRKEYISKNNLITEVGEKAIPNGRKHYWHHSSSGKWRTLATKPEEANKTIHQKLNVTPIKEGQSFYFHVDYTNLNDDELALLLTSIQPQQDKGGIFYHHLGLGKPLGLGSVSVHIEAVLGIDHQQRYSGLGLESPLYHKVSTTLHAEHSQDWQQRYPREAQVYTSGDTQQQPILWSSRYIDKEALTMVRLLGKPVPENIDICYPYSTSNGNRQKAYEEGEGFKWFVENENKYHKPQLLKPVTPRSTPDELKLDSNHQEKPGMDQSRRSKKNRASKR